MTAEKEEHDFDDWPKVKRWLFRYVLVVAVLAFCNRSLPTSFLPIVLKQDFDQPFILVGLAMSMYALGSLVSCNWATRVAVRSESIVRLHTTALMVMAGATCLFGLSDKLVPLVGTDAAMAYVLGARAVQGLSSALYLASNTTLITRFFSDSAPYVLGMVEVCVGMGAQLGRMLGGFLYDLGGFALPFWSLAAVQVMWSCFGCTFEQSDGATAGRPMLRQRSQMEAQSLATPRVCVALGGVLSCYLTAGFLDTMLPGHIEAYIGPVSISVLSVVLSVRSLMYLMFSYVLAQIMHRKLLSFERMILLGAVTCLLGLSLTAPWAPWQMLMEKLAWDQESLEAMRWVVEVFSLCVLALGLSAIFIPALPLMQSEVRHLGNDAVEQVARFFILALSSGEAIGPVIGGFAVSRIGFAATSQAFALPLIAVIVGSLVTYDPAVAEGRRAKVAEAAEEELDDAMTPLFQRMGSGKLEGQRRALFDIIDGDSAYRWRQLPYALDQELGPPGSAPSIAWRREFSPVRKRKPWATAPSSSFRRPFQAPRAPASGREGRG